VGAHRRRHLTRLELDAMWAFGDNPHCCDPSRPIGASSLDLSLAFVTRKADLDRHRLARADGPEATLSKPAAVLCPRLGRLRASPLGNARRPARASPHS